MLRALLITAVLAAPQLVAAAVARLAPRHIVDSKYECTYLTPNATGTPPTRRERH